MKFRAVKARSSAVFNLSVERLSPPAFRKWQPGNQAVTLSLVRIKHLLMETLNSSKPILSHKINYCFILVTTKLLACVQEFMFIFSCLFMFQSHQQRTALWVVNFRLLLPAVFEQVLRAAGRVRGVRWDYTLGRLSHAWSNCHLVTRIKPRLKIDLVKSNLTINFN